MRICHCTLPLTNPDACKFCRLNNNEFTEIQVGTPYQQYPNIKKTIIEKYDDKGNLIERTITESK